jgi:hypothetical protein
MGSEYQRPLILRRSRFKVRLTVPLSASMLYERTGPAGLDRQSIALMLCGLSLCACEQQSEESTAVGQFASAEIVAVIDGGDAVDAEYLLGQIRSVASDAGGRLYAADAASADVKVFSADGLYLQTIGREGQGPGEFQVPLDVLVHQGGLWVRDLTRVTHFLPRLPGGVPDSVAALHPLTGRTTAAFRRGRIVGERYYSPSYFYPLEGGAAFFYEGFGDVAQVDTIPVPPVANIERIRGTSYRGGRVDATQRRIISALARAPFEPIPTWDLTEKGTILAGSGVGPEVQEFDRAGRVVRAYRVPASSRPIPEGARIDSLEVLRARVDSLVVALGEIEGLSPYVSSGTLPNVLPDYISVYAAADGRVWVQLWPQATEGARTDFAVFEPSGALEGLVTVPVDLSSDVAPYFGSGRIVGVTVDEITGVQSIVAATVSLP